MLPGTGVEVVVMHAAPWRMRESPQASSFTRAGAATTWECKGVQDPQVDKRENREGEEGSACAGAGVCATADRGCGRGDLRVVSDGAGEGDGGMVVRRAAEQRLTQQWSARSANAPPEIQRPPGTGGAAHVGREGRGREGKRPVREWEGSGRTRQPIDHRRRALSRIIRCLLDFLPESRVDFFP
jgi:hypothetical protein